MKIQLKKSIKFYNENIRLGNESKMTQKRLSDLIYRGELPSRQGEIRLSKFQNGRMNCSFDMLRQISGLLHVTSDFLLGVSENPLGECLSASGLESPESLRDACGGDLGCVVTIAKTVGVTCDFLLSINDDPFSNEKRIILSVA